MNTSKALPENKKPLSVEERCEAMVGNVTLSPKPQRMCRSLALYTLGPEDAHAGRQLCSLHRKKYRERATSVRFASSTDKYLARLDGAP